MFVVQIQTPERHNGKKSEQTEHCNSKGIHGAEPLF